MGYIMTKLAFIMGAARSGSTLLTMLLASHPQATSIGETVATPERKDPNYRCSCGQRARECPFWKDVIERVAQQGFDLNVADFGTSFEYPKNRFINRVLRAEHRGPTLETFRDGILRMSPGWRRQFQAIVMQNTALFETITKVTESDILIDSSKQPHRLKFLLRIPELEIKVIHLVRNGCGVVRSYMKKYGWSVEKSADEWRRSIQAEEKLLARLNQSQWYRIRYEDLCSGPITELENLCAFLALDPSGVNLDFRSADLHVFGNNMRLSSEQKIRLDEKWRIEFNESQKSTIERLAGRELLRYGYSVNGI